MPEVGGWCIHTEDWHKIKAIATGSELVIKDGLQSSR